MGKFSRWHHQTGAVKGNACVCVCVCVCVKKRPGVQQNSNLGQLFRPCWASSSRCRVMLESEEYCTLTTKCTAPHLWAKFTKDHLTGCALPMLTKKPKQVGVRAWVCVCDKLCYQEAIISLINRRATLPASTTPRLQGNVAIRFACM